MTAAPRTARRLSDTAIRSMKCPAGERRLVVGDGGGLELQVSPSGGKAWYVRCRVRLEGGGAGPQRRVHLGNYPALGLADARRKAEDVVSAARMGTDPKAVAAAKALGVDVPRTVKDAAERYIAHLQDIGRKQIYWGERQRLFERHLLPKIGDLAPKDVSRAMLTSVVDAEAKRQRKAGQKGVLTRRLASVTTALWRFMEDKGWLAERGLADRLPVSVATEKPRDRVLSEAELGEAFVALGLLDGITFYDRREGRKTRPADRATLDGLALALLLGLRVGEVVALRPEDVVPDETGIGCVMLRVGATGAKTDAGQRDLPLPPLALSIIRRRQQEAKRGLLFPSPAGKGAGPLTNDALGYAAKRLCEELGHQDAQGRRWTPHDLRRTLASILGEMDVSEAVQKRILGHAGDNVTARVYDRSKRVRRMLEALTDAEAFDRAAAQGAAGADTSAAAIPLR